MKRIVRSLFIVGFALSAVGLLRIGYFEAKAELAQHLMQNAWEENKQLMNQLDGKIKTNPAKIKPWPWADTWPVFKLIIPRIASNSLVLKDASGESLAFGPGLLTTSIYPGERGNSFIAAHRDTHFVHLAEIKNGDAIFIENITEQQLHFKVDLIKIVDSRTHQPLTDTPDTRITLVTCYPFDATESNTPYRYLVSGRLVVDSSSDTKNPQLAEIRLANLH